MWRKTENQIIERLVYEGHSGIIISITIQATPDDGGKPRREEEETVAFHRLTHWFTYYNIRRSSIAPSQGMSKAIQE